MFCRSCGENIPVDSVFCPSCGKNLLEIVATSSASIPLEPEASSPIHVKRRLTLTKTSARTLRRARVKMRRFARRSRAMMPIFAWRVITLARVLWTMGILFAAAGFIVGLAGHDRAGLDWIGFGLVLVLSAPHAPEAPEANSTEQEMGD